MFKYLKEAFWASPSLPGLGNVPLNVLGVVGVFILGFAQPAIWLAGLAAEVAYLYACFTNDRFRRWVDAREMVLESTEVEKQKNELVAGLVPPRRERLRKLEARCGRVLQAYRQSNTDSLIAEGNEEALKKIAWYFLKLLVAQQNLVTLASETNKEELESKIRQLTAETHDNHVTNSLKESRLATLATLQKRLANFGRREQSLQEIESDLQRIEAQVELALENATLSGKTETISADMDLVSTLLDESIYGASTSSIAAVEERLHSNTTARSEPTSQTGDR
jgi:hypothetical protein